MWRTIWWTVGALAAAGFIYWQYSNYAHHATIIGNLANKTDRHAQVAAVSELIDDKQLADALPTASTYVHFYMLDAFEDIARDQSPANKARAAEALTQIVAMLKYSDEGVRYKAQRDLTSLGSVAATAVAGALGDPDAHARKGAIAVLDAMGPAAIPVLITALQKAPPERPGAIEALVNLAPAPTPEMLKLLADKDKDVRAAAAAYFGNTGLLANRAQTAGKDLLLGLLKDKDSRGPAMRAEGLLKDTRALPDIEKALTDPADVANRRTAIVALGDMRAAQAVPLVVPFLHDDDPDIQSVAISSLHAMADGAIPALAQAFNSSPGPAGLPIRQGVVQALQSNSTPQAIALLTTALHDPSDTVRQAAAASLGCPDSAGAVGPLVSALRDPSPDVAEAAETSLGQIGAPAVAPLVNVLSSASSGATIGSETTGPGGQMPAIVAPYYASQALMMIGKPAVGPVLSAAQTGSDAGRTWALVTLSALRDPSAVPVLKSIAENGGTSVRWFAQDALRRYQA